MVAVGSALRLIPYKIPEDSNRAMERLAIRYVFVAFQPYCSAVLIKIGFVMLGGLARPVPQPPPPGELRKVRLTFRCSICHTEVRMTAANDQMPEPPGTAWRTWISSRRSTTC